MLGDARPIETAQVSQANKLKGSSMFKKRVAITRVQKI
jgi:hypothetical protein